MAEKAMEMTLKTGYYGRQRGARLLIHLIVIGVALLMLFPFWLIISVSFTDNLDLARNGYQLIPKQISFAAYDYLFRVPQQLIKAYGVTIFVTFFGTSIGILTMSMLGYGMTRLVGKTRRVAVLFVLFPVLFSGGLIPFYLVMTQMYKLKDTITALVFPYLVSPFYVLLLRSYFAQLPQEIIEAAKMDGASEFRTFFQIIIPLSTPVLATIGLFTALGYWNDYWLALLFIAKSPYKPLQLLLFNMLNNVEVLTRTPEAAAQTAGILPPVEPLRMAMAVVAAGPGVIFSLALGRYFVRGITLGAISK